MQSSVANSTSAHYQVGWNAWSSFNALMGLSPYPSTTDSITLSGNVIVPLTIAVATGFCAYAKYSLGLAPSTICGYLSGVAFFLKMAMHDADFLSSPPVLMARAGLRRLAAKDNTPSKSRLPVTLDMIQLYGTFAMSAVANLGHFGLYVAMSLAFACLLRRSEYIPCSASDHHIRANAVVFQLTDGSCLGSHEVSQADEVRLSGVLVHIPSSKCDQEGLGFTYAFSATAVLTRNIVFLLFRWAVQTHKAADAPFFSAFSKQGGKLWCIDATSLTNTLRIVARKVGFSPAQLCCFSTHSLRYGGASTLLAAGVDKYQIQLAGRWKSDAFMTYLLACHSLFERTQAALADASMLTCRSILQVSAR